MAHCRETAGEPVLSSSFHVRARHPVHALNRPPVQCVGESGMRNARMAECSSWVLG
jgi:hypothetical protein